MRTTLKFTVYLICFFFYLLFPSAHTTDLKLLTNVHQVSGFYSGNVGETVTLQCFYEDDTLIIYWYKQTLGQKPRLISTFYKYRENSIFHDEFKNNSRFTLHATSNQYHLTISDLHVSDSATYYCTSSYEKKLKFLESTTVSVERSNLNIQTLVHQSESESESVHPGESVTLNCTAYTGMYDGEHSIYWFRKSEDPQPGIIYTHGGRNNQHEKTCVYNLPIPSVNRSCDGTCCAIGSCGHILFGNGFDSEDEVDSQILVVFLSVALVFTSTLVVLLGYSVYTMTNRRKCKCTVFLILPLNTISLVSNSFWFRGQIQPNLISSGPDQ
uniref:Ig-like domain-containing protein n=1 Tax=Sphaeramia orbicularis TaxID=375764 RepID=A0A673CAF1_9TELE